MLSPRVVRVGLLGLLAAFLLLCSTQACSVQEGGIGDDASPAPDTGTVAPPLDAGGDSRKVVKGGGFHPVRVACGQSSAIVDTEGNVWSADEDYVGGTAANSPGQPVVGAETPALYDGQRYGASASAFHYTFDVPAGAYTVLLKFAENFATAAGQRVFDVSIDGNVVLSDFDIYASAGGQWIALDESFPVTVGSGASITIDFTPGPANNPKVDAIAVLSESGAGGDAEAGPPPPSFGLKVQGNTLVSTADGGVVELVGTNLSGLETGYTGLWPAFSQAGVSYWSSLINYQGSGLNAVRFPLNEASWLDYPCYDDGTGMASTVYALASGASPDGGAFTPDPSHVYQSIVKQAVTDATQAGLYVFLDLHWAAPNDMGRAMCPIGQPGFADADHAFTFWQQVATMFKDNPAVVFELFNEPFGANVPAQWISADGGPGPDTVYLLEGGVYDGFYVEPEIGGASSAVEMFPFSWNVAGTQEMVDTIRDTGATNVILVSPIGWAGEIELWLGAQPTDTLHQLGAAWHVYTYSEGPAPALAVLDAGYPIVITETWGFDSALDGNADATGYAWAASNDIGYLWWGWNDWGTEPLSDVAMTLGPPWFESAMPDLPDGG